jgi:hypothetical protein
VSTYGAESWTPNKDVAKEKLQEEGLGELKVNENWRKRYNKELTQLFGDLNTLP